jgi:ketosteroid isomerase-like protein
MRHTQQIARRSYDAWTSGDRDTVARVLSPDFRFVADMAAFATVVGDLTGTEGDDRA